MSFIRNFIKRRCEEAPPAEGIQSIEVSLDYQGAGVAPGYTWEEIEVADAIPSIEVATDYP